MVPMPTTTSDWTTLDVRSGRSPYWRMSSGRQRCILDGLHGDPPRLLDLTVQLTDRCNLACPTCNRTSFTDGDMPLERVLALVTEAATLGCRNLHLTGGEPTVHPDLPAVVRFAVARGMDVGLGTNGWFDEGLARDLVDAGLTRMNVSHHRLAAPPKALAFIDRLPLAVFVNHVMAPDTYRALPDFVRSLARAHPSVLDVQLMPPRGTAPKLPFDVIADYATSVAAATAKAARKAGFHGLAAKAPVVLGVTAPQWHQASRGIYHGPLTTPCYASLVGLKAGRRGYSPCTYLYRDGVVVAGPEATVAEAFAAARTFCLRGAPPHGQCAASCGPETATFNGALARALSEPAPAGTRRAA